ncbi:hypothetical protein C8Q80DRAFT_1148186 [Daedaleopsis nitida]|nr:hypothetical protein C8Q80DRAFT_1148186 [Daedaleopsis nitida]
MNNHPQRASFSFAIGARSRSKGEALKAELGVDESVPVVEINLSQYEHIEAAVKDAKVVLNVVGPYWLWGMHVVRACATHGKRYVDLTGEPHFVRKIIDHFDVLATETGAVIVPSCGFDSIPADILVYLSNRTLKDALGPQAALGLSQSFYDVVASVSGGSLATLMTEIEKVPRATLVEARSDYALSRVQGHPTPKPPLAVREPVSSGGKYGGYWIMAGMNRSIVQRTFGLNEFAASLSAAHIVAGANAGTGEDALRAAYGPQFRYGEYLLVGSWIKTVLHSMIMQFSMTLLFWFASIRWFVKSFGAKSGEGPSERAMARGKMVVTNYTESASSPGTWAKSVMRGSGDPGYFLSAYMITECALAFVLDEASLPRLARVGGILTPATAFGMVLVKRLESTGLMQFERELVRSGESE